MTAKEQGLPELPQTPFCLRQHDETGRTTITDGPIDPILWQRWNKVSSLYTADQMRAYALAALASDTGERGDAEAAAKVADILNYAGWRAVGDAQWTRLASVIPELRAALRAQPAGGGAMLTNPHTGTPRDYRDVETDPAGILIHKTGEPLLATATPEAGVQREGGLTRKQAWWAGARAGLGVPADMPRTEVAALLTQPQPEKAMNEHTDDSAIDRFAAAMKSKMAKQRDKGYGDWDNPAACPAERLVQCLRESVLKGDPVDVGNFAMMLFNRGQKGDAVAPYNVRSTPNPPTALDLERAAPAQPDGVKV